MPAGDPHRLRVAFDVLVAAEHQDSVVRTFGISRVIDEMLPWLTSDRRLDLVLTAMTGPDLCRGGLLLETYARDGHPGASVDPGFRPRLVPHAAYRRAYAGVTAGRPVSRALAKTLKVLDARTGPTQGPFDVFHSTFRALPAAAVTGRATRVLSVYDLIPLVHPEWTTAEAREGLTATLASLRPADHVIVNSHYVRDEVVARAGVDADHVHVVPLAADKRFATASPADTAAAARRLGLENRPYLLSVASTQPRKNLPLLLRAYGRIHGALADPPALVLVGGDAWMPEAYRAALAALGPAADGIVEAGYVPDDVLPGLYAGALAFVFPSRAEGFGLPLVEAMSAGAPVVGARAAATPEVLDGAGILVDPDDDADLAVALTALLDDELERERLRTAGQRRAGDFSWQRAAATTADVYARIAQPA